MNILLRKFFYGRVQSGYVAARHNLPDVRELYVGFRVS
jgi:hypothetical protein